VAAARALEIVDEQGRVRASIRVLPASAQKNGEVSAESVLLRLITERGRPSVKISASEQSAGLALPAVLVFIGASWPCRPRPAASIAVGRRAPIPRSAPTR